MLSKLGERAFGGGFMSEWSPLSKRRQEAQKGVVGLEAVGVLAGWRHLCEHLLFCRQVCFHISMRRLNAFMTEP